jgi:twitching motility two-component system response regulator PilH
MELVVSLMPCPGPDSRTSTLPASNAAASNAAASSVALGSVLIVTSSRATRSMYAEYLTWRGVTVREVMNATTALEHLSTFTPDVVLIEDKLEDGRGVDLVLTLRRSRQTSDIPIALLSGDVFGMTPVRAHRFGCDVLIPIPCLPDALFDALTQLVADGVTERESNVLDSWLFVRNEESVRIVRRGELELSVCGPRWQRAVLRFRSELELSTYQAGYEQRLVNEGFTFEAFRKDRRRGQRPSVLEPKARPAATRTEARRRSTGSVLPVLHPGQIAFRTAESQNRSRTLLQRVR